jgi:prephenate dehydrogenase
VIAHEQRIGRVGIVGAGLIGASAGLALSAVGVEVVLRDRDPEQLRLAVALGAGRPWDDGAVEHALVAVPPKAVVAEIRELQTSGLAATVSDVSSVKAGPVAEAEAAGCDMTTFCGAHPIAGRERGGAVAARTDLFAGRPWVITPLPVTGEAAQRAVVTVATLCRALPVITSPQRHDAAMAALSHLPQLVASMLAAEAGLLSDEELALAGQGFRDVTRLADSDAGLWSQIIAGNGAEVAAAAQRLADRLSALGTAAAADPGSAQLADLVDRTVGEGNKGRDRLPDKAGLAPHSWCWVGVVVADRPGELARLFAAVAGWDVNVEDIHVEHSRNAPFGRLELAVAADRGDDLLGRLAATGWTAYRRA